MAHYHFSAKLVKRRDGRLATQVASYKLGQVIRCERSGRTFDYSSTGRVIASGIEAEKDAPDWVQDHNVLWNAIEAHEVRANSQLLRDYQVALPHELDAEAHVRMIRALAVEIVEEFKVVVGWGIHMPRDFSDARNIVAFLLISTRALEQGAFTRKIREMSVRPTCINIIARHRERWANIQNAELERAGLSARVDHRSLKEQRESALAERDIDRANGLNRLPGRKFDRKDYQAAKMREVRSQTAPAG